MAVRHHTFSVEDAVKYGVEEAVLLQNIRFWCDKNLASEEHIHDGYAWTYNSVRAFSLLFPYWTTEQIRRCLDNLEAAGAVITGNFNKAKYDKTKWYTTSEHKVDPLGKRPNRIDETPEPIPVLNTVHKPTLHGNFVSTHGSEDFEEYETVAVDDNGEEIAPKKKPVKKYPGADEVIKLFPNPSKFWLVNVHIRAAASRLYEDKGVDKIKRALEFYEENKEHEYCPKVFTPIDLEEKWTKLFEFKTRNNL